MVVEQGFYADEAPRLVVPFCGWIAGHHQAKPGYAIAAESPPRPKRVRRLYPDPCTKTMRSWAR